MLFTSTPGFHVDVKMAEMMKDANPKLKVAFVGPPVTVEPEKVLARLQGHRLRRAARVRLPDRRFRQRQAAGRDSPGVSFRKNGGFVHNPGRPGHREPRRAALGHQGLQARPRHHALQRPVPAAPVRGVLHLARLPGHVHLLPVAADALRPPLAPALGRATWPTKCATRSETFPGPEGDLLRRRHLQLPEGAHHRALPEAEAAELHLVLHLARHHRLRDAQGDEGGRLPAADRRLRIRRPADPQEHQEGRHRRDGAALHRERQEARPGDSRRLHRRPARRNAREPSAAPSTSPSAWTARPSRSRSRIPTPAPSSTTTSSRTT